MYHIERFVFDSPYLAFNDPEYENKVEQHLENEEVNDAFPRGRYAIFDDYSPNVPYLSGLANCIRKVIPYQYKNAVEIVASENNSNTMIGKFIFPDFDSDILIFDGKKEPTRVVHIQQGVKDSRSDLSIKLIQTKGERVLVPAELSQPESYLLNWREDERWRVAGYAQIAYDPSLSVVALKYMQEGKEKQLAIIDGEPTHLFVAEKNNQNKEDAER